MAELVIRKGEEKDLDRMAEIEKICFSDPWSREVLYDDMVGNRLSTYVVAEVVYEAGERPDGSPCSELAGYVGFWMVFDECQINNVAVRKDLQRRHIASIMLSAAMDAAKRAGAKVFTLEVRAGNDAAKALYRKFGFTEDGVRPNYYSNGEDAILMSCTVD